MRFTLLSLMFFFCLTMQRAAADSFDNYSPFIKGHLQQWPAVVLILEGGGSMGADSARVYVDDGSMGVQDLGLVNADGGDNLWAFFAGGMLYFENRAPLPGQCHACGAEHMAIQRFKFVNHRLAKDGSTITVEAPKSQATYDADLQAIATKAFRDRKY